MTRPDSSTESVTSTGAGYVQFSPSVLEGNYTITEASKTGWTSDGGVGCSFSVDFPADKNKTFSCTFTNTRDTGSLAIAKTVSNPDGATLPASFSVNYDCGDGYAGNVTVAPGSPATVDGIPTGSNCSLTEIAPDPIAGYTWETVTYSPATVEISAKDGTFEIAVGNSITRDRGSLKILKTLDNPDGANVPATFSVDYDCGAGYSGNVSVAPGSPVTVSGIPTGSSCKVSEVAPEPIPGYAWGNITYSPALVIISTKDEIFEITIGNSISRDRPGKAMVAKTVNGLTPAAGQTFVFELRQGASTSSDGTTLETQTTDISGSISFATSLVPGQTYQLCEQVLPGWNTKFTDDGPLFVPNSTVPPSLPNSSANSLTVCADFSVTSGQTRTSAVDNAPPQGAGGALTIGFWKNWASCAASKGGQEPVLDRTLAKAEPVGEIVSAQSPMMVYLVSHGNAATPDVAPDCLKAVRILDKSTIDAGKKMASDPAFNLAAQLLAAELNFTLGALPTSTAINAVNQAVVLLGKYRFDGIRHDNISLGDARFMNNLAAVLDNYNNNR